MQTVFCCIASFFRCFMLLHVHVCLTSGRPTCLIVTAEPCILVPFDLLVVGCVRMKSHAVRWNHNEIDNSSWAPLIAAGITTSKRRQKVLACEQPHPEYVTHLLQITTRSETRRKTYNLVRRSSPFPNWGSTFKEREVKGRNSRQIE
ncbi:uncharacterized protein F5891DRAFT_514518 [Suillus fuscotomentosus]|uniref:Secreted protein n=1 Tax=Suillus fuscotomentosus TaxID=1912939 RepID=A0AAD4HIG6_9AGAM|nr:uncharacterized protein F5891DRAFT_514518 [Suillus fuscotomentosus]KAG1897702.1 hypothetical protein F5891DRAFT_514518 [Suillus fuscotomentosus]